jgi:glycosyltransferase involved in cell wall biosynthesis
MEGMSHGRPAVGPDEGGVREVVGEAGTLVSDRTPRGYADALHRYLDDPRGALEVGRLGRRRAEERFSFDRMVAQVETVYEGLVK